MMYGDFKVWSFPERSQFDQQK